MCFNSRGKSEMLVLDLYCRVKIIRECRVGLINDDGDEDDYGGGDTSLDDGYGN
jgi:hypothetical protein